MKKISALLVVVLLSACQHEPIQRAQSSLPTAGTTVVFHANRFLEIEPCGCSLTPTGGIEREANFLNQVRGQSASLLPLASGTTFVPERNSFKRVNIPFYRTKSNYLVRALNDLGLKAFAPSINDFQLGKATIQKLQKASSFPWLSANIVDKRTKAPVFQPFLALTEGEQSVLIVGLSQAPGAYPGSAEVEITSAKKALDQVLAKNSKPNQLVIVLGDLTRTEIDSLGELLPKTHLVLGGGSDFETLANWEVLTANTLMVNPSNRGRAYARIDLNWSGPFTGFYSQEALDWKKNLVGVHEIAVREAEYHLKNSGPKANAATWNKKLAAAKERIAGLPALPEQAGPGLATAIPSIQTLDASFNGKNAMTDLIGQWLTEVRSLAVKGG